MGKGSGRRPQNISDEELEKAWNSIFAGHPNEYNHKEIEKEVGYGNIMTPPEKPKPKDPDKFIDDLGDA